MFRVSNIRKLECFDFDLLKRELLQKAPVLMAILKGVVPNSKTSVLSPSIVMATAILLNTRSNHLCILQALIGIILYSGHASKVVS